MAFSCLRRVYPSVGSPILAEALGPWAYSFWSFGCKKIVPGAGTCFFASIPSLLAYPVSRLGLSTAPGLRRAASQVHSSFTTGTMSAVPAAACPAEGEEKKLSANERRRLRKAQQTEEKKQQKSHTQEANGAGEGAKSKENEELDPRVFYENRCKYVESLRSQNAAYPHKFHVTMSLEEFQKKYGTLEDGAHRTD